MKTARKPIPAPPWERSAADMVADAAITVVARTREGHRTVVVRDIATEAYVASVDAIGRLQTAAECNSALDQLIARLARLRHP